jgi:DNA ligase-1
LQLKKLNLSNCVLDGEACIVNANGKEDFSGLMTMLKSKNIVIQKPKMFVFDFLTLEEFQMKRSEKTFLQRQDELHKIIGTKLRPYFEIAPQTKLDNAEQLLKLHEEADRKGWEGVMIRKNTIYEGKRTKNLLKVKTFEDAEFEVVGIEKSEMGVVIDGKEIPTNTMKAAIIKMEDGNEVHVGSGFSIDERRRFLEHPEEIIGKIITVQYFEKTLNKDGMWSLRFPTFKFLHGVKREV